MEVEQMMTCLLEEMKTNQTKMDASLREMKEEMPVKMEANQGKVMAKLDAHRERMMIKIDSQLALMEACLGKTEATGLETNPEERKSKMEHEEVHKEKAAVKAATAMKKRHGDQHLTIRCCDQLKKLTQVTVGLERSWPPSTER
jgi:hypothetical protein